jgi:UPF0042 nucleotide-binding protein
MTKPQLTITSFGYGHDTPPTARITVDVRDWFRDPHISPELRKLTGKDEAVIEKVLNTENVMIFLLGVEQSVRAVLETGRDVSVAFGCVGGRHRSVVLADTLNEMLLPQLRWSIKVSHRDLDKDVLTR